tara:strand:+ start:705 stop:1145 length:441 start_codon:yes stop_codon:yes gene_type:complete
MPFGVNETLAFIIKTCKTKPVKRVFGGLVEEVWAPIASAAGKAVTDRLSKSPIPIQDPLVVGLICKSETIQSIPPLNADVTARYLLDEALKSNDPGLFRKLLEQTAAIQSLDPKTVATTIVCCTASLAKGAAPYLKNICAGLLTGI